MGVPVPGCACVFVCENSASKKASERSRAAERFLHPDRLLQVKQHLFLHLFMPVSLPLYHTRTHTHSHALTCTHTHSHQRVFGWVGMCVCRCVHILIKTMLNKLMLSSLSSEIEMESDPSKKDEFSWPESNEFRHILLLLMMYLGFSGCLKVTSQVAGKDQQW